MVEPRVKFTTGRPKPRLAKPLPVTVKVAGGAARSIVLGTIESTPGAMPVTARCRSPPLEVKLTLLEKTPEAVGLKRTTTVAVAPSVRVNVPPETTLKGGVAETLPVSMPPPVFWMAKVRSAVDPDITVPKSCDSGVTERLGGTGVPPIWSAAIHVPHAPAFAYSCTCQIVKLSCGSTVVAA